jgi:hypothetical protein
VRLEKGIPTTMTDHYYYRNLIDYHAHAGTQLLNAQTIDELQSGMRSRYHRLAQLTGSKQRPYEDHRTSKEHVDYFEQRNPGYSGDFRETWNSTGMRQAHEISTDVDCCFYGCSMTWGTGVPDTAVWANQLARSMNWSYNNFAVPGVGQEECANLFMVTGRMVKMRSAIFMLPDPARVTQAFKLDGSFQYHCIGGAPNNTGVINDLKQFHKDYISLPNEYFYNKALRNLEIIARLAELQGIRTLVATWAGTLPQVHNLKAVLVPRAGDDKTARDKNHPGCEWHTKIAQRFQTAIKDPGPDET